MSRKGWKRAIFQRDRWFCYYCRCQCKGGDVARTDAATIDHKTPVSRGGMSTKENMVTACRGCNEGKGGMTVAEYERAGMPRREYQPVRSAAASLKAGWRTYA